MKIHQGRQLSCPTCRKPFIARGHGHEAECPVGLKYVLPQQIHTGYRMLVFGSRDIPVGMVPEMLGFLNTVLALHQDLSLLSGGATGGDSIAESWAAERGVAVERWLPQYDLLGRWVAPLWRNAEMAARFPDSAAGWFGPCTRRGCGISGVHGSHGPVDMAVRARDNGVKILPHTWGGLDDLVEFLRS